YDDEGVKVSFQGRLRSDENFNAKVYWLSISCEEELHLSTSLALTIRRPILKVLSKMITYVRKGIRTKRESMICCEQFIIRIDKRMGWLTKEVLNSLSAPTYYRVLDATTLRELIGPNERLIAKDPTPGVPRVAIPIGPYPSMQDLYDRMGSMEIRQGGVREDGP
nr:hypothetical protein [Tanacetum cinerariifolium]